MRFVLKMAALLTLASVVAPSARAADFPFASSWVAESLGGADFAASHAPTLDIGAEGRISGSAGCNRYTGKVSVQAATLGAGAIAMTRMMCAGPAMENENRYAPALSTLAAWRMDGKALVIETARGPLRFRLKTP